MIQVGNALNQYQTEYGKWPDFTGDGTFLDAARNAQLMRVLRAQDPVNNPRGIVFLKYRNASRRGYFNQRLVAGFEPTTGALLDPWGNPYRMMLDADYDGTIQSPHRLDPDPVVRSSAIVWSLGKDGGQADSYKSETKSGTIYSDDVFSWL